MIQTGALIREGKTKRIYATEVDACRAVSIGLQFFSNVLGHHQNGSKNHPDNE